MNRKLIVALVSVFLSTAAVASMPTFDELDINEDGVLTIEETLELEDFDFLAADVNDDGELSREEYEYTTTT